MNNQITQFIHELTLSELRELRHEITVRLTSDTTQPEDLWLDLLTLVDDYISNYDLYKAVRDGL